MATKLKGKVQIKRIYDDPSEDDGYRVLVDRLWPRGVSKERADLDLWLKEVAPSTDLRKWFGHKPERFAEFKLRYRAELANNTAVKELEEIVEKQKAMMLLYAAHDTKVNHAVVLRDYLIEIAD
jgi:uncharacterized protein YeaO (DUF488 family)